MFSFSALQIVGAGTLALHHVSSCATALSMFGRSGGRVAGTVARRLSASVAKSQPELFTRAVPASRPFMSFGTPAKITETASDSNHDLDRSDPAALRVKAQELINEARKIEKERFAKHDTIQRIAASNAHWAAETMRPSDGGFMRGDDVTAHTSSHVIPSSKNVVDDGDEYDQDDWGSGSEWQFRPLPAHYYNHDGGERDTIFKHRTGMMAAPPLRSNPNALGGRATGGHGDARVHGPVNALLPVKRKARHAHGPTLNTRNLHTHTATPSTPNQSFLSIVRLSSSTAEETSKKRAESGSGEQPSISVRHAPAGAESHSPEPYSIARKAATSTTPTTRTIVKKSDAPPLVKNPSQRHGKYWQSGESHVSETDTSEADSKSATRASLITLPHEDQPNVALARNIAGYDRFANPLSKSERQLKEKGKTLKRSNNPWWPLSLLFPAWWPFPSTSQSQVPSN